MSKPEGIIGTILEFGEGHFYAHDAAVCAIFAVPKEASWGAGEYVIIRPEDLAARIQAEREEADRLGIRARQGKGGKAL